MKEIISLLRLDYDAENFFFFFFFCFLFASNAKVCMYLSAPETKTKPEKAMVTRQGDPNGLTNMPRCATLSRRRGERERTVMVGHRTRTFSAIYVLRI